MIDEDSIRQKAFEDGVTHFATGIAVFKDGKLLISLNNPHFASSVSSKFVHWE